MKNFVYQKIVCILLLIIPVAGQEKSESELAIEKVYSFTSNEKIRRLSHFDPGGYGVQDEKTVAKIDAFVASMKTDAEKISAMTLFQVCYAAGYTTQEHTERVMMKFLSDKESLRVRVEAVNYLFWRDLAKKHESSILQLFKEEGHSISARGGLIRSLSRLGLDSLIEIAPYLDSEDNILRNAALDSFARMAPKMTLDRNLALLTHADAHERKGAVIRLTQNGESVAPSIYPLLDDSNDAVRAEAVKTLDAIVTENRDYLFQKLKEMSNDDSPQVRSRILSIISENFKGKSIPFRLGALKDENQYINLKALKDLRNSTIPITQQIELITPFLKHADDSLRVEAVRALGFCVAKLQNDDTAESATHNQALLNTVFKQLETMSSDESVSVRGQALSTIVHRYKMKSSPFILEALKDKNRSITRKALSSLASSTISTENQIELITPFLTHPEHWMKFDAVRALGHLPEGSHFGDSLFKQLEQLSTDDVYSLRSEVISVIIQHYTDKSNPFILMSLEDENESVVESALKHLRNSTISDKRQIELNTPFLKHPNKKISVFAQQSLELLQQNKPVKK